MIKSVGYIGLGSKYMNFVDSQLSKSPYPTFSLFISAFNKHELRMNFYDEQKPVDQNLVFLGLKDGAR